MTAKDRLFHQSMLRLLANLKGMVCRLYDEYDAWFKAQP